jgi:hypothetical protein
VDCISTDVSSAKRDRRPKNDHGEIAEVWYDLNINGLACDLTATFRVVENSDGLVVKLNDIHVM